MTRKKIVLHTVVALLCAALLFTGCARLAPVASSDLGASSASEDSSSSEVSSQESGAETSLPSTDSSQDPANTSQPSAASKAPGQSRQPAASQSPAASSPQATSSPSTASSAPASSQVKVTIPEGSTFMQIADLLEQKGVCSKQDFYKVCQSYTLKSFSISTSTDRCFRMEGYLFPDTYYFYPNDNPQNVLVKMLNNYAAKTRSLGLSEKTLILASIIEKEARSDENRKLVASVFMNRLNNSTEYPYLDADPTRDYVNQFIAGNVLVASPARYAALYNTCGKRMGLPAGPVCCPGISSIRAAQNPATSDYYYFFYGKDSQNHYSKTLEEHNALIAQYGIG